MKVTLIVGGITTIALGILYFIAQPENNAQLDVGATIEINK